jgi:hypothetical protein
VVDVEEAGPRLLEEAVEVGREGAVVEGVAREGVALEEVVHDEPDANAVVRQLDRLSFRTGRIREARVDRHVPVLRLREGDRPGEHLRPAGGVRRPAVDEVDDPGQGRSRAAAGRPKPFENALANRRERVFRHESCDPAQEPRVAPGEDLLRPSRPRGPFAAEASASPVPDERRVVEDVSEALPGRPQAPVDLLAVSGAERRFVEEAHAVDRFPGQVETEADARGDFRRDPLRPLLHQPREGRDGVTRRERVLGERPGKGAERGVAGERRRRRDPGAPPDGFSQLLEPPVRDLRVAVEEDGVSPRLA